MIIFKRLPDGTWGKSGSILPTENLYTIAVDAENIERKVYPCEHAVREVENRIKAGTTAYRFELAGPPASLLKAARRAGDETVERILGNAEPKTKSGKPNKAATKSRAKKKETGKQRRTRLKAAGICTACGKRKARKGRTECKTCSDYYKQWAKDQVKKGGKR